MSKIEWTDVTWNPVTGCQKVHDGCKNCYALTMSARLQALGQAQYKGTTERIVTMDDGSTEWRAEWEMFDKSRVSGKPRWSATFRMVPSALDKPLRMKAGKRIFVNSMSDLFGEGVSNEYIASVFAVAAATPQHHYVALTKRPARAIEWFTKVVQYAAYGPYNNVLLLASDAGQRLPAANIPDRDRHWPLPNVAIGVSVSDQSSADEFMPLLAQIPTVTPIVSVEPMLGPVDLSRWLGCPEVDCDGGERDTGGVTPWGAGISEACLTCRGTGNGDLLAQVIIGAESGPGARACQIEWARDLARQVLDAQTECSADECDRGVVGVRHSPKPGMFNYITGPKTCAVCRGAGTVGPALFVKQWPVCAQCHGRGLKKRMNDLLLPCGGCGGRYDFALRVGPGSGQSRASMTRKRDADSTPRLWVPGHGFGPWTQEIRWPI